MGAMERLGAWFVLCSRTNAYMPTTLQMTTAYHRFQPVSPLPRCSLNWNCSNPHFWS